MKIALLPGDGIGPEIVAEAVKVLKGLDEQFEFEEAPIGGAGYEASGRPLPDATLALAQQADAVIVGARLASGSTTSSNVRCAPSRVFSRCARS
jgi:3-isopropylmalate dehydrogenase